MYSLAANIELLIMNILFLGVLFAFNIRYWKPKILNPISAIYLLAMVGCVVEMVAFESDGNPEKITMNYLSNIIYLGSIGCFGGCMLAYAHSEFPEPIWKSKKQFMVSMIPIAIEMILLISTPWTKIIFYVDELGYYHRSNTFFFQFIPYGYLLYTTVVGIHWFMVSETTRERTMYLAIALFSIPPFLLGGIQLFVKPNSLDILESSVVISLLANYAVSQNNRITRDALTNLNNREMLDSILQGLMKNGRRGQMDDLYVLIGDLDGFKKINDVHGHLEGDKALITAANVLDEVCQRYRAHAARYGGDEFVIVVEAPTDETPQQIIREVEQGLSNACAGKPYPLSMSIGWTTYRSSDTIPDILKAADRELYRVKAERKKGR